MANWFGRRVYEYIQCDYMTVREVRCDLLFGRRANGSSRQWQMLQLGDLSGDLGDLYEAIQSVIGQARPPHCKWDLIKNNQWTLLSFYQPVIKTRLAPQYT